MKTYILSVLVVAIVCSIFNNLVNNRANAAVLKMTTGLVVLLTILQPLKGGELMDCDRIFFDFEREVSTVVENSEREKQNALSEIINKKVTSYILKQAQTLHADVTVEVTLSDESMPVPENVRISGKIAPYAKQQLINIIERELGVAEENQIWK